MHLFNFIYENKNLFVFIKFRSVNSELARNDMNKFAYKAMKLNRKAGEQSPRLYDLSFPT